MSQVRFYVVLPNPLGVEAGVYLTVYDQTLRQKFARLPRLCQRVPSREAGLALLRDEDFLAAQTVETKFGLMHGRCWYCGRSMDAHTVGRPNSAEIEHQVPRATRWEHVNRSENIVMACRRCNNGAFPGKGDLDVVGFRKQLEEWRGASGLMFYGEVLRHWRDVAMIGRPCARNVDEAVQFLNTLVAAGQCFHSWSATWDDYVTGSQLTIPAHQLPYGLGAPELLPSRTN